MGSDHEAEIRASVGAHHDLGPGYEDAVAEGLVERIGAEIDRRIDARLRGDHGPFGPPGVAAASDSPRAAEPGGSAAAEGYPPPWAYPPGGYHSHPGLHGYPGLHGHPGYQGYQVPTLPPGYPVQAARSPEQRSARQHSVAMTFIALGSMALGVAATAIVAHARNGGQAVMVLLIWAAITIVNLAYARRC
jgi:hypothetical protein